MNGHKFFIGMRKEIALSQTLASVLVSSTCKYLTWSWGFHQATGYTNRSTGPVQSSDVWIKASLNPPQNNPQEWQVRYYSYWWLLILACCIHLRANDAWLDIHHIPREAQRNAHQGAVIDGKVKFKVQPYSFQWITFFSRAWLLLLSYGKF